MSFRNYDLPNNCHIFEREAMVAEGNYLYSPVVTVDQPQKCWTESWNFCFNLYSEWTEDPAPSTILAMRWGNDEGWTRWRNRFAIRGYCGQTFIRSLTGFERLNADDDPDSLESVPSATRCQLRLTRWEVYPLGFCTLAISHYNEQTATPEPDEHSPWAWGREIEYVAKLCQLNEDDRVELYPSVENGRVGHRICSPTSLTMAHSQGSHPSLALLALPEFATWGYDETTDAYGVWAISASTSYNLSGDECYVCHLGQLTLLEKEIGNERTAVVSLGWDVGELENASQPSCRGHLVTVVGFTKDGDVIVHDPNTREETSVRRVLKREQFFSAWRRKNCGSYLFRHIGGRWTKYRWFRPDGSLPLPL